MQTSAEDSVPGDLRHDDPETILLTEDYQPDYSLNVNLNDTMIGEQSDPLIYRPTTENDPSANQERTNAELVLEASRRIYIFDWISDFFIGTNVRKAQFFALSFVGSGFKTLALMLLLVFWNLTLLILTGLFNVF